MALVSVLLAAASPLAATGAWAQATATAATSAPETVRFGTWGVDITTRDMKVRPGDDFQRFASGAWLDANAIPADKSSNGVGSELNDRNQERLRTIVTGAPAGSQLGALYASYMDEARLETLDAVPLEADLARVDALATKADFLKHMGATASEFGASLFGVGIFSELARPTINGLWLFQGGMGLPDRDYYLVDKYKPQREAYRAYIERSFKLLGKTDAAARADAVLAFETELAKIAWPQTDLRNFDKHNNPIRLAGLSD